MLQLIALREGPTDGVKVGRSWSVRPLSAALLKRIEVRAREAIQPTFRLCDSAATGLLDTLSGENGVGQTPDMADDDLRFTSRRLRWS